MSSHNPGIDTSIHSFLFMGLNVTNRCQSFLVLCMHELMQCLTTGSCVILWCFTKSFHTHLILTKTYNYEDREHKEDKATTWVWNTKGTLLKISVKGLQRWLWNRAHPCLPCMPNKALRLIPSSSRKSK